VRGAAFWRLSFASARGWDLHRRRNGGAALRPDGLTGWQILEDESFSRQAGPIVAPAAVRFCGGTLG